MSLENAKKGDLLIVLKFMAWKDRYAVGTLTVDRVTKTQVICGEVRFRVSTGVEFTDRDDTRVAVLASELSVEELDKHYEEIKQHKARLKAAKELRDSRTKLGKHVDKLRLNAYGNLTQEQLDIINGAIDIALA